MTPQSLPAAPATRSGLVLVFALLWALAFVVLSGSWLVYNCRIDGPPALFSNLLPVGVGTLVIGLYGLIRQL